MELQTASERLEDGTRIVSVAGEIDLYTAPLFERELFKAVNDQAASVLVDLTECGFIDSTALGILLRARRRLGPKRLRLVCTDRQILKVLDVTGLAKVFAVYPSRASALNRGDSD